MDYPRKYSDATVKQTEAEIAERLRHLCRHLGDAAFRRMVEEMTRIQLKYEARVAADALHVSEEMGRIRQRYETDADVGAPDARAD